MYKRIVTLVATDFATGEKLFQTSNHRVTFEVDVSLSQGLAKATVGIYNLSTEESKKVMRGDLEPVSRGDGTNNRDLKKVRIQLYAGYLDEIETAGRPNQLLLEGFVMNATSVKKLPNHVTFLYLIAYGSNFLINSFTAFDTPGGNDPQKMNLEQVLTKVAVSAGYEVGLLDYSKLKPSILEQEVVGETIRNDRLGMFAVLDDLAERYSFVWGVRANGLGFYPTAKDSEEDQTEVNYWLDGNRKVVNPALVRGAPIAGLASLEIKHVLDASLFPGVVLDVGELGGKGNNDSLPETGLIDYTHLGKPIFYTDDVSRYAVFQYYTIHRVIHKGDTHGEEWDSTLVCKVSNSGILGDDEIKES